MPAVRRRKQLRHIFWITLPQLGNVDIAAKPYPCRVKTPRRTVELVLKSADIRRAIAHETGGVGNSMTCSMAMCCDRLRGSFAHPVVGWIDWLTSTCFVVSRMNRYGEPLECYRYVHNSTIAHINDQGLEGQRELLRVVEAAGGSITVTLRPRHRNDRTRRGGSGRPLPHRPRSTPQPGGGIGNVSISQNPYRGAQRRVRAAQLGMRVRPFPTPPASNP